MPEREICVRAREPADLGGCVRALAAVHRIGGYPTNWPADPARWLSPPGTVRGWVATADGSIAGHVLLRQPSCTPADPGPVEVSRLFVTPAYRRMGVAAALLRAPMRWAAENDKNLELEVTEHLKTARALYERSGFRLTGTRRADWTSPDGAPVTLHHYAWSRDGAASRE